MNKQRRKWLEEAIEKVEDAIGVLEEVTEEERKSLENLPDNFRYGERGEEMEGYIEMLEEASEYLADANSVIEQI